MYLVMDPQLKYFMLFLSVHFLVHLELKLVQNAVQNIWSVGQIPFEEKPHITIVHLLKTVNEKSRDYLIKNGTEKMNLK